MIVKYPIRLRTWSLLLSGLYCFNSIVFIFFKSLTNLLYFNLFSLEIYTIADTFTHKYLPNW